MSLRSVLRRWNGCLVCHMVQLLSHKPCLFKLPLIINKISQHRQHDSGEGKSQVLLYSKQESQGHVSYCGKTMGLTKLSQ